MVLGTTGFQNGKIKKKSDPYIISFTKILTRNDQKSVCMNYNSKTVTRKHKSISSGPYLRQWFLRFDNKSTSVKEKKIDKLNQNLKQLYFKGSP